MKLSFCLWRGNLKELKEFDSLTDVAKFIFNLLFSIIGVLCLIIFNNMSHSMQRVEKNVAELNSKVATAMESNKNMNGRIDDHEKRLREIEKLYIWRGQKESK